MSQRLSLPAERRLAFGLIVTGTVLGIAGTDLVLPAVPSLPVRLGGTVEQAQMVLAVYVLGTSIGLLAFGELGARFDRQKLLVVSFALFALVSLAASAAPTLESLIGLRFAQGAFGAAPAVFAPGLIRALYGDDRAAIALGRLGAIESLTPALAPLVGAYLVGFGGWQSIFFILAALALSVMILTVVFGARLPATPAQAPHGGGYRRLFRDAMFLRYALSQALSLGSLLVFVFGVPAVFAALGHDLGAFILLQILGVSAFIAGTFLSAPLVRRVGEERVIVGGTALLAAAFLFMLAYALAGGDTPLVVTVLFLGVNLGFGLRGPPGFHRAVVASKGDEARGAALVVLGILGTAAAGTAIAAPFLTQGLAPLIGIAAVIAILALASLAPARQQPTPG